MAANDDLMGSIPAHAGEPVSPLPERRPWQVYPRARGGASVHLTLSNLVRGLSPRTRGSRVFRPNGAVE